MAFSLEVDAIIIEKLHCESCQRNIRYAFTFHKVFQLPMINYGRFGRYLKPLWIERLTVPLG